jgi:hypothetical protein
VGYARRGNGAGRGSIAAGRGILVLASPYKAELHFGSGCDKAEVRREGG